MYQAALEKEDAEAQLRDALELLMEKKASLAAVNEKLGV